MGIGKNTCIFRDSYAHPSALYTHCKDPKYLWNRNQKMGKGKVEKRGIYRGCMAKAGTTSTKIARIPNDQEAPMRLF